MTLTSPLPMTFRKCLWLCLPALLVGLALRIAFLISIPEGYFGADSNSYFETADHLWNHGHWEMGPKRRGLYPLFMLLTTILPGSAAQAGAVLQHAMGLAALVGIGWITAQFTVRPRLWVPVVTLAAAFLPQPLWYEHELIADKMLADAVILAISLALPIGRLRTQNGLFWFLIACAALIAVKPHGRPFWLGLMIAAVVIAGNPLRWGLRNHGALALSLLLILTTGSSKQGSWLFLSSTLPLVNLEGSSWPEYRAALRPQVEDARTDLVNYPWRQNRFKKVLNHKEDPAWAGGGKKWAELLGESEKFSKVAKSLAVEAARQHPITFGKYVLLKFGIAISKVGGEVKFEPALFWAKQGEQNDGRWAKNPKSLERLYEMDAASYQKMAAERAVRPSLLDPRLFKWTVYLNWMRQIDSKTSSFPPLRPTWFAFLGCLGIAWCLRPGQWRQGLLLVLPCFFYLGLVYVVGDSLPRYIMPVEWFGVLFGALGCELILSLLLQVRHKSAPALAVENQSAAA